MTTLPAWMIDAIKREEEAREQARDAARPRVYAELPIPREPEKKAPEKTRWL